MVINFENIVIAITINVIIPIANALPHILFGIIGATARRHIWPIKSLERIGTSGHVLGGFFAGLFSYLLFSEFDFFTERRLLFSSLMCGTMFNKLTAGRIPEIIGLIQKNGAKK